MGWIVRERRPLFSDTQEWVDTLFDIILKSQILSVHYVELLGVAADHVHVYMETDGGMSLEKVIGQLKRLVSQRLMLRFPNIRNVFKRGQIWEEGYWVETVSL